MTAYLNMTDFRTLTRVKQSKLGVLSTQPNADLLLQTELDRAAAYVEFVTGQPAMDSDTDVLETNSGALSPTAMPTMLRQAIQMRTEQVLFQAQNGYVDDASDDVVSSLSVGGFSQSKFQPSKDRRLNSWNALGDLLWLLMTPDRYSWWVAFLSGDAELMIGPAWGIEQTLQQTAGPQGGWGFWGVADYAWAGSGWLGWGGGLPNDIFPLPVD